MIKHLATIAFAIGLLVSAQAQDYRIERQPFGNGYNVYGPAGQLQQTIQRQPFGNGYDIHTMPQSYHW
jgi:hypothetical protein